MMRLTLLLVLGVYTSCKTSNVLFSDVYLPRYLQQIDLGISKENCLKKRPKSVAVHSLQPTPRLIYSEEAPDAYITTAYYFFEKESPNSLVEIHLIFTTKEKALLLVQQRFGAPKKKQNKWQKKLGNGQIIHATLRKNKLFIYKELPSNLF